MNAENAIRYVEAKDNAGLKSMVSKAIGSYGKARIAVQVAIVAILIHAAKHNDYSQASDLVNGLGKTATARNVALFFRDFGGLGVKDTPAGEEKPQGFNTWQGPKYIAERLDEAKATMFWAYKQPAADTFREYSLEDMARQFLQRHENARKQAAKGKASLDDTLSDTTMQAVLNLVKFEAIKPGKAEASTAKGERKAAAAA